MLVPLAMDVTIGDRITSDVVECRYLLLFGEGKTSLMIYPIETELVENSRP